MSEIDLFTLQAKAMAAVLGAFEGCVKAEGVKAKDSEYGVPYRLFQLDIGLGAIETLDADAVAVAIGAVKGGLQAWTERGAGPVFIYRNRPEANYDNGTMRVRFRAHFLSQEAYDAGPVKPVENTA